MIHRAVSGLSEEIGEYRDLHQATHSAHVAGAVPQRLERHTKPQRYLVD
ncbi:hypothetical protein LJR034_003266 [Caballeronia sp. LjRoot34]